MVVVGGVARNRRLRELLSERADAGGIRVEFPEADLCTDNGAMVAAAGAHKFALSGGSGPELDCAANLPLCNWAKKGSDGSSD